MAKSVESAKTKQNEVKENPVDLMFLALAALYEQLGQSESALGVYNNILKRNPNCVTALVGRGIIELLYMHDEKAMKDLHKATGLAPRSRLTLRSRGLAHMLQANFEKAESDFAKLFDENDWDSLSVLLGYAFHMKQGNGDIAVKLLGEAVSGKIKNKDWPYPQLQLMQGEIDMSALMAMAATKSRQVETRAYSGFIAACGNNPSEGKADLAFVQEAKTGTPLTRLLCKRGLIYIEGGDQEKLAARQQKADRTAKMDWMD